MNSTGRIWAVTRSIPVSATITKYLFSITYSNRGSPRATICNHALRPTAGSQAFAFEKMILR
jgi:hypothetical protein